MKARSISLSEADVIIWWGDTGQFLERGLWHARAPTFSFVLLDATGRSRVAAVTAWSHKAAIAASPSSPGT